jgi:hypothetical protein
MERHLIFAPMGALACLTFLALAMIPIRRIAELCAGDLIIVPRGVEHRTAADEEAEVLIFEPAEVRNTGDVVDATFTAPQGVAI